MQQVLHFLSTYGWFIGIPLALITVTIYVFRPSAKKMYEQEGKIPLADA